MSGLSQVRYYPYVILSVDARCTEGRNASRRPRNWISPGETSMFAYRSRTTANSLAEALDHRDVLRATNLSVSEPYRAAPGGVRDLGQIAKR